MAHEHHTLRAISSTSGLPIHLGSNRSQIYSPLHNWESDHDDSLEDVRTIDTKRDLHDASPPYTSQPRRKGSRPHFWTKSTKEGYVIIISLFLGAGLIAIINHIVFSYLDGSSIGTHVDQFWVSSLRNVFPTAVTIALLFSLKCCLSQVALYRMRSGPHSMALVNLMTSPPGPLNAISIALKSSLHLPMLRFVLLMIIAEGTSLTSIFIPGSLTITPTSSRLVTLEVPNIDFNAVAPLTSSVVNPLITSNVSVLVFNNPSVRWNQLVSRSVLNNIAPIWDAPAGCGLSCNYTFTYVAPALNCSEFSREYIWPNNTGSSNPYWNFTDNTQFNSSSRLLFPLLPANPTDIPELFFYNTSYPVGSDLEDGSIMPFIFEVTYLEGLNTTFAGNLGPLSSTGGTYINLDYSSFNPRGVHCEIVNATYEATTSFSNNSQSSSTRVSEWGGPVSTGPDSNGPSIGTETTNMTLAYFSIAYSFAEMLNGNASIDLDSGALDTSQTRGLGTPLFNLATMFTGAVPNLTTVSTFSLSSYVQNGLASGLQDLFGNVTLAFINEKITTTHATASVLPNTNQYSYNATRLGIIYGTVFGACLIVVGYGILCIWENGTTAVFDLEHIIKMTAGSTGLHELAAAPGFSDAPTRAILASDDHGLVKPVLDIDTGVI